jgi:hypothetical protein
MKDPELIIDLHQSPSDDCYPSGETEYHRGWEACKQAARLAVLKMVEHLGPNDRIDLGKMGYNLGCTSAAETISKLERSQ